MIPTMEAAAHSMMDWQLGVAEAQRMAHLKGLVKRGTATFIAVTARETEKALRLRYHKGVLTPDEIEFVESNIPGWQWKPTKRG
jgi:asparagine synthetase A